MTTYPFLSILLASAYLASAHDALELRESNSSITMNRVDLPLDHFAKCSDTYSNRYIVHEGFYRPGGPVFVYDGGEEAIDWQMYDMKKNNSFTRLLEEFGAMGIAWEHRYYGKSYPEEDSYEWLEVEQALADIPAMAVNFSRPSWPSVDFSPASTPWVIIGGSYPGMRAAWSRQRYPETFHAAWAASAPVDTRINGSAYWLPVIKALEDNGFGGCVADSRVANKKLDEVLEDETAAKRVRRRLFGKRAASWSNFQVARQLMLLWLSYAPTAKRTTTATYCNLFETDPSDNSTAPLGGWAPTKGVDWVFNRMIEAYVGMIDEWTGGDVEARSIVEDNEQIENSQTDKLVRHSDSRSWHYQECTTFGEWITYEPWLDHFFSTYYGYEEMANNCLRTFPGVGPPRSHQLKREFGGWNARPSNTFWTADEFDSWRPFTPLSDLPEAPPVNASLEIPACGLEVPRDKIFGHVLPGLDHVDELRETEAAHRIQKVFSNALNVWLPCFEKKKAPTYQSPPKCAA